MRQAQAHHQGRSLVIACLRPNGISACRHGLTEYKTRRIQRIEVALKVAPL
jgi:hypothetical protein